MKKLHARGNIRPMITTSPAPSRWREWHGKLLRMMFVNQLLISSLVFWSTVACAAQPNVVMILADDQSYRDFGFLGNDLVHTPNIDRLAAQSARYPNGYVPMSVCRPSLATLLTALSALALHITTFAAVATLRWLAESG